MRQIRQLIQLAIASGQSQRAIARSLDISRMRLSIGQIAGRTNVSPRISGKTAVSRPFRAML
jgi:hypothetical protein